MIFISHRGNLDGSRPLEENHPDYIEKALNEGYVVEIDVWSYDFGNDMFYLGHEGPIHKISGAWMRMHQSLLCHAKTDEVLSWLAAYKLHFFYHETDPYTVTSKGWPIAHVDNDKLIPGTIQMMPEKYHWGSDYSKLRGVCSDYIQEIRREILAYE